MERRNFRYATATDQKTVEDFERAARRFGEKHLQTREGAVGVLDKLGALTKKGKLKKAFRG